MAKIKIDDLNTIRTLNARESGRIVGGRFAESFLFRSGARGSSAFVTNLNIDNFELNYYDITNEIDKMINQTNNQLQLSMINVEAGSDSVVNILSNQGLNGANSSVA